MFHTKRHFPHARYNTDQFPGHHWNAAKSIVTVGVLPKICPITKFKSLPKFSLYGTVRPRLSGPVYLDTGYPDTLQCLYIRLNRIMVCCEYN